MPMLYSLFQHLTRSSTSPASRSPSYKLASWRSGDSSNKRSKRFRHPLSVPNDTVNGSDEHIVTYPDGGGGGKAEAYSTPALTRQGSRYGREEGGKGIQVRTELSVRSSEVEKGEGGQGQGQGQGGYGVQRPPMGYVRSYA